ncbi:uncharacterized protein CLAFUR5_08041 [Fulvia fulva]|uniref:F-box domain-containing protein n=1 Tax=Passalora fulva TaxID=5499 RepID=A0A9Q8LDH9_PASFU|nr:uncharacterized protein CLAFUR5_08041 [Fulvia fulva]KAK4630250.1 hypothetical protein CLAFUR0_07919 [Fulvia fulva]UJO14693.1 hypothetical protein CLAFUR5_08041 [Fulvia fulva]
MAAPLPNDVVLIIISHLDVDTFLDFRLTCHNYHVLISAHINELSGAVARNTFPGQTRIFTEVSNTGLTHIQWLKSLRYHQLGSILVEQTAPYSYRAFPIAANDPAGGYDRDRLAQAWKTFTSLASMEVDSSVQSGTALDNALNLCRKQCEHILTVPYQNSRHLSTLLRLLQKYIIGEPSPERDAAAMAWQPILAILLQEGPELFWKSWWVSRCASETDRYLIKRTLENAWRASTAEDLRMLGRRIKVLLAVNVRMRKYGMRAMRKHSAGSSTPTTIGPHENPTARDTGIEFSTRIVQVEQLVEGIDKGKVLLSDQRVDAASVVWDELQAEYIYKVNKKMEALGPDCSGLPDHRNVLYGRPWPGVHR